MSIISAPGAPRRISIDESPSDADSNARTIGGPTFRSPSTIPVE